MPDDADFAAVVAGSLLPNRCTPPADELDFRGIRLAAPAEVRFQPGMRDPLFGAFARLIVCGVYRFDSNYLGLREQFLRRIAIVAVDATSHHAYVGRMQPAPNAIRTRSPFDGLVTSDADWAGRSVRGYFNPNLAQLMPLPEGEASYLIYAALGRYLSNVVRIKVRSQGARGSAP